jgi:small subunit ribosomal protein S15
VIITRELLSSDTTDGSTTTTEGGAQLPKYLNFGLTPSSPESILLFSELPELAQKVPFLNEDLSKARGQADWINHWAHRAGSANKNEERARDLMLKLVDLKNASSEGLKFENRRRIVEAFGEPGKSNDTGRPEVQGSLHSSAFSFSSVILTFFNIRPLQAALLTYKIRNLHSHLTRTRRDIHNRRSLRHLVHQRAKVLKYLKGVSRERYAEVLERLGLDRRAVEGEIIV